MTNEELNILWDKWVADAPWGEEEGRAAALEKLKQCLADGSTGLDLGFLGLSSLPDELPPALLSLEVQYNELTKLPAHLPSGLQKLNAGRNKLTVLPDNLPSGLKELSIDRNDFTVFPDNLPSGLTKLSVDGDNLTVLPDNLPSGLTELSANFNALTVLPDNLPSGLTNLSVNDNQLTVLPGDLPSGLTNLSVNGNQLTVLPDNLPSGLTNLSVNGNQLTVLPGDLPSGLTELSANFNALTVLPDNLPSGLTNLSVNHNQLTVLPDNLPLSLLNLNISGNHILAVPEFIYLLQAGAEVSFENNPLSVQVLQALMERAALPGYSGPQIRFSVDDGLGDFGAVAPEDQLLHMTVADWFSPEQAPAIAATWSVFEQEDDASTFNDFLNRLGQTVSGQKPSFREKVATWLTLLSTDSELREQTFHIAGDATTSCGDRIALGFNAMQKAAMVADITQGNNTNLPDLISKAREVFRLEQLEEIARIKVKSLPVNDEIEVYLAYEVQLRTPLGLTSGVDDMTYFQLSGVTEDDLKQAEAQVKAAENRGFTDWLSRWDPWRNALARISPTGYENMEASLEPLRKTLEVNIPENEKSEYQKRVEQVLREEYKLSFDPKSTDPYYEAVFTKVCADVNNEFWDQAYAQLTRDVLGAGNVMSLMDSPWPADSTRQYSSEGAQALLSHQNLLTSVARTLSDLVSPYRNMGANVRFAPQSFLLGDDAERGICTSLSQAWLFALSQGDGGKLASTLLDDIFLYSQGLVDDASAQGRLPGELSQQVSDFLNILSGVPLPTADGSQRQSLSDIIQTLSRGTDDKFFSLQAGNHLMAIARDTRNGQVFLRFYDPNAAVVEIPVGTDAAASARALGSIIQGYLGSPVNGGTLADFYHMVQPDGALQFTVSVFSPSEAAAQPGMQSLLTRLQKDMTASPAGEHHTVTPPVIQGNLLPEPVETLRQNLAEVLKSFQAHQQNVNIQLDADAKARLLLDHILTSVSADAGAGAEGHLNITGLTVLPEDAAHEGKIVLDVVYRNLTDGSTDHHVSVVLDPQDFVPDDGAGAGHTAGQSADEQAYQQGFSVLGKAQNIYTLLTSVTGLINSIGQGNTQGEAINGTFLTMSVTDITGLTDKLADRLGQAIGLGDGGGLSGLLGGMAGKLAGLAGLGEEAAAAVGKFVAEVPVLNFAMVGYSVYSDVQNLENTTDEDARNRAIGTLTVDTITGAITVAASVAGMLGAISSDAAGSIGGVVAGVGIMIDVMINPWDPMGFRSLINPDSIKLGNDIEQEGLLWTNHTDGLYVVRPSAGSTGGYLSFILTPGDLSDVRNFLNNPLSTTVLNAISEDIKGMSADELKSYAADYHQSTEDTIYNLRLLFSASDNPSPSDADMNNLLQQFWKALDVLNEQTWISNDNNLLYLVNHDTPLPVSAHNGDMQVILDEDGQGFTLGWTTAPQDIKNVERMTSNEDGAVGPEIMAPRHVSLAQGSNDILMGSGQADTIHFYDPADTYAQQDLTLDPWTESSSFDSGINTYSYGRTNDQGWDMTHAQAGVDSTSASFHLVPYKRQFTVTGNSADNKFYSAYNDPEQRYDYIVSGGGGDDTLLMSQYGYYNFEGGANGEKGDWVVAPQAAGSDGSYILYDLESAGSPVQTAGLTMRINFGLTLSDVENIQGNAGNELFHGSAGKNIIVTGGGNDVVWLSGGGDTYQASLNGPTPTTLVIHGQTGRDAAATRDGVIFDSPLSSLYFSQSPSPDGAICTVSYAANSVQLVDGAADQVVFGISKNLSVYFHSDGKTAGLIALLQTGDVGTLKTLKLSPVPGAIDPDARSLTLPTGEVINLGFGLGFSIMVPDSESGHRLLLQYAPDSQGNLVVSQATVFLSDNEHLLTVNLDTLRRQRDNLGVPVEFISPDGVSFRLKEITDSVTGKVSHTLIIDNFGSSDDTIAGKMSGWADQQGIDTLVADLNSLKSGSNPIVVDPEFVETSIFKINGGGILLDVGSLQALQPAPGGSENGLLGITLQDNTTLSFSDTTQWDHLVLLVSDTFGNQTEVDYAADGSVSRYITQLPWGFSAVDVSALNALSAGLSSPMKWVTKDGISFHFADSKGADGKMLRSMIIDNLDPGTWPDAVKGHSGESPLSATGILTPPAGVTRVVLDIDVLRARCLPGESLVLGLGNSGDTVLRVSVNSTDLAQLSHSLPVHFESGDRLTLPDGTFIFTDGINWGHVTLLIHAQDTGLDWMLNYTDGGANATPALVKILSSDPLNPDGLLNGNVTHKLTGSESQHYTSDITVSPADSLTLEGDDRDNNITGATNNQNTLLGDAGNDTLTGGSQDDWFVGGAGADHMIGGTGSDTVQFTGDTSSQEGVLVNLSEAVQKGGEAEGDRLEGIENIVGSGYDDTLYGDTGNNALYGGAGNDTLGGLGGTDLLAGGQGADTYRIASGDQVVISQADNGTATDILNFEGVETDRLNFVLSGDDLVISGDDRVAVLKDWNKGDNHYTLSGMDAAQFSQRVASGLAVPSTLKDLAALYQSLNDQNRLNAKEQVAEQNKGTEASGSALMSMSGWHVSKGNTSGLMTGGQDSTVGLNGPVTADEQTAESFSADADYRLEMDVQASPMGIQGLHVRLKVGDTILAEGVGSSGVVQPDGLTYHLELTADGALGVQDADGKTPLVLEVEEDKDAGGVIIEHAQLLKLTGAMASFGGGAGGGVSSPGVVVPTGGVPPVITAGL